MGTFVHSKPVRVSGGTRSASRQGRAEVAHLVDDARDRRFLQVARGRKSIKHPRQGRRDGEDRLRKDGPRVHGFVGFDPLRQALYDDNRGGAPDGDPMAVVRRAIEVNHIAVSKSTKLTGGFIGVKLYPPMGFRATDNKHLPDANFNEPAYLRSTDTGLGSHIGSKLDAALAKLSTRGVAPITCLSWRIPAIA